MIVGQIGSGSSGNYTVSKSLRFRSGVPTYLSRVFGAPTNQDKWTLSIWLKRGSLSAVTIFGDNTTSGTDRAGIYINATGQLVVDDFNSSAQQCLLTSSALFRDPSAHYHFLIVFDVANATSSNRVKIYANGDSNPLALTGTAYASTAANNFNTPGRTHYFGHSLVGAFDGLLSEINFVDGQALTASSFGQTDSTTGAWVPKKYAGTYGNNGFYLDFSTGTNLTTLCQDKSGNGNNWTANGHSLTTGANYDWLDDTPSNTYATLNPIYSGRSPLTNGNLTASGATDLPTIVPDSGTWYFEVDGVAKTWTPPAAFPAVAGNYNFGQRPWQSTGPTGGQKALCTANLPDPAILNPKKHFDVLTHVGNGTTQNVTGTLFTPDLAWCKNRSVTASNNLYDSVRGANQYLLSDSTAAEGTASGVTAFLSNGISVGALNNTNGSGNAIVDWLWKAGGAAAANTAGSITSQVSANVIAGFSIATFNTTAVASQTWGHGLGVAPKFIITKWRDAVDNWYVYHASLGATQHCWLNLTSAVNTGSTLWNSTAPSSSVVTFGSGFSSAHSMVAYCFAEVPGFSKFGSYTGNGLTDGQFVHLGFKPRWIMVKRVDSAASWWIYDSARDTYNLASHILSPNVSDAEYSTGIVDFISNGFKLRGADTQFNASGGTYIYAAFAECPFKYANGR